MEEENALFAALAENNTLKTLDLTHTAISEYGFNQLCEALKKNQTLESVNIKFYSNFVSKLGVVNLGMIETLAYGLLANQTLKSLTLQAYFESVRSDMLSVLVPFLEKNHSLTSLQFIGTLNNSIFDPANPDYQKLLAIFKRNQEQPQVNNLHRLSFLNECSQPKDFKDSLSSAPERTKLSCK